MTYDSDPVSSEIIHMVESAVRNSVHHLANKENRLSENNCDMSRL